MKLISCHIENFGKLHDYSMDFSSGANIICEKNGWGKSTFAAFVRAMFYGLGGGKKRSVTENERKRYQPWQGGVFGGRLIFEIQGKQYQISRIFKDKDANDVFELRDVQTNRISIDYTENIGKEIFKIDRESFLRTIFIGQNECETTVTADINGQIGNLTDDTNELNNFDSAQKKLTEMIKSLKNPTRSSLGSINRRADEITSCLRRIQDGNVIPESMEAYQANLQEEEQNYEKIKCEIEEVGRKHQEASKMQSVFAKKSEWERLKNRQSEGKNKAETLRKKFPGEVPEKQEVSLYLEKCRKMEHEAARASAYQLSALETREYEELAEKFAKGTPEQKIIEEKIIEAGHLVQLTQELAREQLSSEEKARFECLKGKYEDSKEDVNRISEQWSQRNAKKSALVSKQATLETLKASLEMNKIQKHKRISPLMIIGAVLMLIGAVIAIAVSGKIGMIITATGGILLVAGFFTNRPKTSTEETEGESRIEQFAASIKDDIDFIQQTDEKMKQYFEKYGKIFQEHLVTMVLQEIVNESIEYSKLKEKVQKEEKSNRMFEINALTQTIEKFLAQYGMKAWTGPYSDELHRLKSQVTRFENLQEKIENYTRAEKNCQNIFEEIRTFFGNYQISLTEEKIADILDAVRELVDEYEDALSMLASAKKDLEQFESENEIALLEQGELDEDFPSLEDLSIQMKQLTEEKEELYQRISCYNQNLENLQEQYDEWEEQKQKLRELKILQEQETEKFEVLVKTRQKLEEAKESMTAKYADPILKSFSEYYEMITRTSAKHFYVDSNTKVTVNELGQQRDTDVLSSGYKDLIGICLRIALIDAMYQTEAPVLIMDDPFTNLDDDKISAGRTFLESIAKKYQVIYFTCSQSRS